MKKMILKGMVGTVIALTGTLQGLHAQDRGCGTMEHQQNLQAKDPSIDIAMRDAETTAQHWLAENRAFRDNRGAVTVPVVVHIVSRYQVQIPSVQRIHDQIDVLNEAFNAQNADITNVPSIWTSTVGNAGIEFCLAKQDPFGNPTTGITYDTTTVPYFTLNDHVKFDSLGGCGAWDPTKYINIWVCNLQPQLLGYAQFPWNPAIATKGIVLSYKVVGRNANQLPDYNLGRTAVHEMGHFFGLRHIWGDDNGACTGSDYCADTPNQGAASSGCPSFPLLDNCSIDSNGCMFFNYMDYSNDACMYMFTNDQTTRMHTFLNTTYASLLNSISCQPVSAADRFDHKISISPNPSNGNFEIDFNTIGTVELTVFDAFGKPIEQRSVQSAGATKLNVDLSGKTAGFYFVRLQFQGGQTSTHKLILQ